MENTNAVSILLIDVLSELLEKRIVMSGDDYIFFENLEKVSQDIIDEAIILKNQKEDKIRIQSIKQKANEIIKSRYSIEWQLNHPRMDETYVNEYAWIDNIRRISNEAESNGTKLEEIIWQ